VTGYAAFEIVVVPFAYSDRLAEKRRPALIVSSPSLEAEHGLLWVAMVTSQVRGARPGDVIVTDLRAAGLPAPSLVRPTKLTTIEPARVLRTAGRLRSRDVVAVRASLDRYLAAA
jgi:mRNA interferase MazF